MACVRFIFYFATLFFMSPRVTESLTLTTNVGQVYGFNDQINVKGSIKYIHKFLGIPYAEPPIGDLRFAKPVPRRPFQKPFNATEHGSICYQVKPTFGKMDEDCLYLNIVTPHRQTGQETFAVMIWIHGGGFIQGSANEYPLEYISAAGNVIVVSIHYRLSELGFLSYGDDVLKGNYGLWDQHLAIKWVHDNIQAFGGDTSRVTIFGESAGSASVMYQAIYPGNRGLFQRVIAQSGSVTSPWAFTSNTTSIKASSDFTNALGCSGQTSDVMVKCMRGKTATQINTTMNLPDIAKEWAPVVDNEFVLDIPEKILEGSSRSLSAVGMFHSVDLIIGYNSFDGVVNLEAWMSLLNRTGSNPLDFKVSRSEYEDIMIPKLFEDYYHTNIPAIVTDIAKLEFTDWSDSNDDAKRLEKLASLSTDMTFAVSTIQTANKHAETVSKSTYVYKFSTRLYPSHIIAVPKLIDGPLVANHADDVGFIFRGDDPDSIQDAASFLFVTIEEMEILLNVSSMLVSLWTDFAKTGDPNFSGTNNNFTWSQYNADENYLEITPNMTSRSVKQGLSHKLDFFKKIVPELLKLSECKQCEPINNHGFLFG